MQAEAAQLFAKNFNIALESIKGMTDKINDFIKSQALNFDDSLNAIKLLNARKAAMIAKLGGNVSTATDSGPGSAVYNYA